MQCRKHGGGFPCIQCMKTELKMAEIVNNDLLAKGKKAKHDLTALREGIKNLG